jgi:hypothetical protein
MGSVDSSQHIHYSEEELLWDKDIPTSCTLLDFMFIANSFFTCLKYRAMDGA